jgi:hypothetical protein
MDAWTFARLNVKSVLLAYGEAAGMPMVGGYEKSPDYGGHEPPKWFWLILALVFIGIPAFIAFALWMEW